MPRNQNVTVVARKRRNRSRRGCRRNESSRSRSLRVQPWTSTIVKDASFSSFSVVVGTYKGSKLDAGPLSFKMDDMYKYSSIASVYDQFMVKSVDIEVTYLSTGSTNTVQVVFAYDPDGGTMTVGEIFARTTIVKKFLSLARPSFKLNGLVPASVADDGRIQKQNWYDFGATGIQNKVFNIGQMALLTNDTTPSTFHLMIETKVHVECKGQR